MSWRFAILAGLSSLLLVVPTTVFSAPPEPEELGTWRFRKPDRPVKVISLGGSVAAKLRGSYSQLLGAACRRVEVVNIAKARIGARQLKERFVKQVLKNRRLNLKSHEETWLLFQGGLNSLSTPGLTNEKTREIFAGAHRKGIRTVGITLGPWGSAKRWFGADGLDALRRTRAVVDFVMGKLSPSEALGRYAKGRTEWSEGDLPNIAVNIYDSKLRDDQAPPLEQKNMQRRLRRDRRIARELKHIPEAFRESALERLAADAQALSNQFMKARYKGFDSIHPNNAGHKVIAEEICAKVPATWDCSCQLIAKMAWDKKARSLRPIAE